LGGVLGLSRLAGSLVFTSGDCLRGCLGFSATGAFDAELLPPRSVPLSLCPNSRAELRAPLVLDLVFGFRAAGGTALGVGLDLGPSFESVGSVNTSLSSELLLLLLPLPWVLLLGPPKSGFLAASELPLPLRLSYAIFLLDLGLKAPFGLVELDFRFLFLGLSFSETSSSVDSVFFSRSLVFFFVGLTKFFFLNFLVFCFVESLPKLVESESAVVGFLPTVLLVGS